MKNPFDKSFFKFLLGFSCILSASLVMLIVVGYYGSHVGGQEVKVLQNR